ncbi:hypothetical protein KR026_009036, partial [Drosophila bipectinata]
MSALYQIDKLEETNYDTWKIQMRSVLVHSGLWSVTSGELTETNVPEGQQFAALDSKALANITLSVKTSQLAYIKNCLTAVEAWTLKEVHQPSGPVRIVQLYKKLLNKRMEQGQSMTTYISEFVEILDCLTGVGIDINDELRTIVLLSSLPEQFEHFVVAMETRDQLPSLEILTIK